MSLTSAWGLLKPSAAPDVVQTGSLPSQNLQCLRRHGRRNLEANSISILPCGPSELSPLPHLPQSPTVPRASNSGAFLEFCSTLLINWPFYVFLYHSYHDCKFFIFPFSIFLYVFMCVGMCTWVCMCLFSSIHIKTSLSRKA